jgi:cytochrome c553
MFHRRVLTANIRQPVLLQHVVRLTSNLWDTFVRQLGRGVLDSRSPQLKSLGVTMISARVYLLAIFTGVVAVSCMPQNKSEYVASDTDFADYTKWTLVDRVSGPSENLQGAHLANDVNTTRTIYIKGNADRTDNGKFPVGTTLVKHYTDKENNLLGGVGMVKRGGGFNKEFGGWEWFVLDVKTGKIAVSAAGAQSRGAITACNQCHAKTADNDYVFTR